jgi:hypothetical protein
MVLTGFLDLRFSEPAPSQTDGDAFEAYEGRKFEFEKYQRDMEAALATVTITIEEQRKREGRPGAPTRSGPRAPS